MPRRLFPGYYPCYCYEEAFIISLRLELSSLLKVFVGLLINATSVFLLVNEDYSDRGFSGAVVGFTTMEDLALFERTGIGTFAVEVEFLGDPPDLSVIVSSFLIVWDCWSYLASIGVFVIVFYLSGIEALF